MHASSNSIDNLKTGGHQQFSQEKKKIARSGSIGQDEVRGKVKEVITSIQFNLIQMQNEARYNVV